jgi:hypothetical protein
VPDPEDPAFPAKSAVALTGLRKLQMALTQAASRSRGMPAVIGVRTAYDDLMTTAANGPAASEPWSIDGSRSKTAQVDCSSVVVR